MKKKFNDEKTFRKTFCNALELMNFEVLKCGPDGPGEHGIDIIALNMDDLFSPLFYFFQLKIGKISVKRWRNEIFGQIEAMKNVIPDVVKGKEAFASRHFLVIDGTITPDGQKEIQDYAIKREPRLEIIRSKGITSIIETGNERQMDLLVIDTQFRKKFDLIITKLTESLNNENYRNANEIIETLIGIMKKSIDTWDSNNIRYSIKYSFLTIAKSKKRVHCTYKIFKNLFIYALKQEKRIFNIMCSSLTNIWFEEFISDTPQEWVLTEIADFFVHLCVDNTKSDMEIASDCAVRLTDMMEYPYYDNIFPYELALNAIISNKYPDSELYDNLIMWTLFDSYEIWLDDNERKYFNRHFEIAKEYLLTHFNNEFDFNNFKGKLRYEFCMDLAKHFEDDFVNVLDDEDIPDVTIYKWLNHDYISLINEFKEYNMELDVILKKIIKKNVKIYRNGKNFKKIYNFCINEPKSSFSKTIKNEYERKKK